MSAWSEDDLRRIGAAEELEIAPVRRNGERYASIVDTINDEEHRATTLRLVPQ
jgi:hypothetical protein